MPFVDFGSCQVDTSVRVSEEDVYHSTESEPASQLRVHRLFLPWLEQGRHQWNECLINIPGFVP